MARDAARFARLARTWWTRGQITHTARESQRPDLHKRATLAGAPDQGDGSDWVDLHADPSIIGTEKR